jgi:hypothetical protein
MKYFEIHACSFDGLKGFRALYMKELIPYSSLSDTCCFDRLLSHIGDNCMLSIEKRPVFRTSMMSTTELHASMTLASAFSPFMRLLHSDRAEGDTKSVLFNIITFENSI